MKSVEETFLLVLELKLSLKAPSDKKFTFKIRKKCSMCEGYGHHAYECSSIKCSKCGEFRHYDYQYPSKSLHTDIMCTDDIDNSRIVEDVHIASEVISDVVDELVKSSTPTLEEIHVRESIIGVQDTIVESSISSHDVRCPLSKPTIKEENEYEIVATNVDTSEFLGFLLIVCHVTPSISFF